ncbi:hypothetical protein [Pseudomonas sp. BIOMIG1BAC]|uniref:hypothetical protein n=1 Tax=Pseudomonas sp. BIOMIG1BAC TaxID=1758730 RepID=UPI001D15C6A8|nr:hypothetical protein [Pseudomonas sp. BIOMIG1BAC]
MSTLHLGLVRAGEPLGVEIEMGVARGDVQARLVEQDFCCAVEQLRMIAGVPLATAPGECHYPVGDADAGVVGRALGARPRAGSGARSSACARTGSSACAGSSARPRTGSANDCDDARNRTCYRRRGARGSSGGRFGCGQCRSCG